MENNHKEALNTFVESLTKEKNEMISKINSLIASYSSQQNGGASIDIESGKKIKEKSGDNYYHHHHTHHCGCPDGMCNGTDGCQCHHHQMMMACSSALERIATATEQLLDMAKVKIEQKQSEN